MHFARRSTPFWVTFVGARWPPEHAHWRTAWAPPAPSKPKGFANNGARVASRNASLVPMLGAKSPRKNLISHIDASLSRQPLVKGERLVRYEVNAVMSCCTAPCQATAKKFARQLFQILLPLLWLRTSQPQRKTRQQYCSWSSGWLLGCAFAPILAEGAMTLPVTLSGGVLFAS